MNVLREQKRTSWLGSALVLLALAGLAASCKPKGEEKEGAKEPTQESKAKEGEGEKEPPFGTEDDLAKAKSLWSNRMKDYTSWKPFPGHEGWEDGNSPHGSVLRYFVNETAAKNTDEFATGSILVKENFTEESEDALVAVTVMEKVEGYDPDNADWFWVKYSPKGEVMSNPAGKKLAGRVAKGADKGCIACHKGAAGDDYVFANDDE